MFNVERLFIKKKIFSMEATLNARTEIVTIAGRCYANHRLTIGSVLRLNYLSCCITYLWTKWKGNLFFEIKNI